MVLFIVLWRQSENKAAQNYKAYDELRQKLLDWSKGHKTVSSKDLAKKIREIDVQQQGYAPPQQYVAEHEPERTPDYTNEVVDTYGTEEDAVVVQDTYEAPVNETYEQMSQEAVEQPAQVYEVEEVYELTPEELAVKKEQSTLRNLNIMLYMASFLLVAAAAAFVAAAMPEIVRLAGLLVTVLLFYVAGIVLYQRAPRFKPAAIAFVGTGLAILPFAGVALTLLGGVTAPTAWLITSLFGLGAYVYAGVVLQSQVVSYLSMAFVLSLTSSAVSVASLPTVAYFIALIGVSLVASTISYYRPGLLPGVFKKPVETTGQIVTPVALVASVFVGQSMTIGMYETLFAVCTAHYLVVWLQRRQLFFQTIVRVLAHFTVLIVAWDITNMPLQDSTLFGVWWVALLLVQTLFSLVSIKRSTLAKRLHAEKAWLAVVHVGLVVSLGFWLSSPVQPWLSALNIVLLGMIAFTAGVVMRQPGWGYVSLASSLLVPFIIGRDAAEPQWPYFAIVCTFAVLALASLTLYWRLRDRRSQSVLRLIVTSIVSYILALILSGLLDEQLIVHGWSMVVAGALLIGLSYAARQASGEFIGVILSAYGIGIVVSTFIPQLAWKLYAGFVVATLFIVIGAVLHHFVDKSKTRRDGLVALALTIFAIFALLSPLLTDIVHILSLLLTLAILVSVLGLRWLAGRDEPSTLRSIFIVGYIAYLAIAWYVALSLESGWLALYYTVATGVLWLASRLERQPAVVLLGNVALVAALVLVWQWLKLDSAWLSLCVGIVASGILYIMYTFYVMFRDTVRQWLMLASSWLVLVGGVYFGHSDSVGHQVVSVVALVCSVMMLAAHRYVGYQAGKDSGKLTALIGVAAVSYFAIGSMYLVNDTQLAAWTYVVAAVSALWLSYRVKSRLIEVFAAVELVSAIWLAVSLTDLGEWRPTISITLSVILLALGAFMHQRHAQLERRNAILAVLVATYALLATNFYLIDSGIAQLSFASLAVAAVASIAVRWVLQRVPDSELRAIMSVAYVLFTMLAWVMSINLGQKWIVGASALAVIIFWVSSYIESKSWLLVPSFIFVPVAFLNTWNWLEFSSEWSLLGVAWLSAAVYYLGYWAYISKRDSARADMSLSATLLALVAAPLLGGAYSYSDDPRIIATFGSLVAASLVVGVHGFIKKYPTLIEIAAYVATFGLQVILGTVVSDIGAVWYMHWWSFVIAVVAVCRQSHKTVRLAVAMGIITVTVGLLALAQGGVYQILFLIEHVILLAVGALLRKQWAVWWGIAATVAAIFYFIKEYTYLWLGLLGLALIALVVWRLNKIGKSQKK